MHSLHVNSIQHFFFSFPQVPKSEEKGMIMAKNRYGRTASYLGRIRKYEELFLDTGYFRRSNRRSKLN